MKLFKKSNFHGGIHPTDGTDKALSNQKAIINYCPKTVEISMKQSGGSVCDLNIQVNDRVSKGQIIGVPNRFGLANIHASISGTVEAIHSYRDILNLEVPYVVIRAEDSDVNASEQEKTNDSAYRNSFVDISGITKEMIISSMKENGIIGMGGAGFPTHIKYETDKNIDYILVNAAECEPYLTCDHILMLEYAYEILNGVLLLQKAANAKKAIICLEDNKTDVAEHLESLINQEIPIEIRMLHTKYPQGGERQLTEAVIGKEVPAGGLPADIGVIINNVGTAKALADSIFKQEPLISRCITVTGHVANPGNYYVPIGTRYSELIELVGGFTAKKNRVVIGGPMTGTCIQIGGNAKDLEGSVTKTSSGIVVLEDYTLIETPCIKCGQCERICPAGLAPFKIDFAAINEDINLCEKLFATECISCGSCSYVCPADRELAYRITEAKIEIIKKRRERGGK